MTEEYSRDSAQKELYGDYIKALTSIFNSLPKTRDEIFGDLEFLIRKISPREVRKRESQQSQESYQKFKE